MRDGIRYLDRESGRLIDDRNPDERFLRWLYHGRSAPWPLRALLSRPALSSAFGWWSRRPWSRRRIKPFIEACGVDAAEFAQPVESFGCFSDFFERRLRSEARPFDARPERLPCPADGKLLVFPALDDALELPIKGARVTVAALLASDVEARSYREGGAAMVVRLAPQDYHRFHFLDDGTASGARRVPGRTHSVHPLALAAVPSLLAENKRAVTTLASDHFGRVACVEVGAMTVGTIRQTYSPGRVRRGQEKGTFRLGGSTIAVLFEPGCVAFDRDLVEASGRGLEVQVKAGSAVGRRRDG